MELTPGIKFCGNCGAPVAAQSDVVQDNQETVQQNDQMNMQQGYNNMPQDQMNPYYNAPMYNKRKMPVWAKVLIIVFAVLLVAAIGFIIWMNVDPVGYMDFKYSFSQ